MGYNEKIISAEIRAAAASGALKAVQPMTGTLNMYGRAAGIPIHYGTTEFWNSQPDLVGKKSHIYIYSDYAETEINGETVTIPNIKIGDGNAYLIDNPFITASVDDILKMHIDDTSVHVHDGERDFWNDKVRCYIDPENPEKLIFTAN